MSDSDYEYFYEDVRDNQPSRSLIQEHGVRYVPVSQITTPPTITDPPSKTYDEIVNKDFYDVLSAARNPPPTSNRPRPVKNARRVADPSTEEETKAFPLGNPYHSYYYSPGQHPASARSDNGGGQGYYAQVSITAIMVGLHLQL